MSISQSFIYSQHRIKRKWYICICFPVFIQVFPLINVQTEEWLASDMMNRETTSKFQTMSILRAFTDEPKFWVEIFS